MDNQALDYQALAQFSETWGLLLLVIIFLTAVAWALWPSNKARFEDAAQVPLREELPLREDDEDHVQ